MECVAEAAVGNRSVPAAKIENAKLLFLRAHMCSEAIMLNADMHFHSSPPPH